MIAIKDVLSVASGDAELVDIKRLNYVSRQIAEAIGVNNTILVLSKAGGQQRYIPAVPNKDHALVQEFGLSIVNGLAKLWSGKTVELPMPDKLLQQVRNHRIVELKRNSVTNRDIIKEFGITRRRIEQIMLEFNDAYDAANDKKEEQGAFNF